MKRYDSYKDSGVEWIGEIPSGWRLPKLKFLITDSFGGEVIDKSFWGDGEETLYTTSKKIHKSDYKGFNNERRTTLDDLLLSRNGDGIVHIPPKGCIYTNVVQLVRIKKNIDRRFLWYSLTFQIKPLNSFSDGDFIVSLNKEQWFNLLTPLPKFDVQQQIVSFLDSKTSQIDGLIQKKERKIELLKEYRTSLIKQVVTKGLNPNVEMKDSGVEWIGEIPSHWEVKKLKYVSTIDYGISPPDTTYNDEGIGEVLVNGPVEYSESDFGYTRSLKWTTDPKRFTKNGSLLFCLRGSTTGRMNITHMDLSIGRGVCSINSTENQWFLIYSMFIVRIWIQEQISGSTFPSVTKDDVDNFIICSPPLQEQLQIVEYLDDQTSKIDNSIQLEEKKIELLKEYRQSLISSVVTGKIDVRTN